MNTPVAGLGEIIKQKKQIEIITKSEAVNKPLKSINMNYSTVKIIFDIYNYDKKWVKKCIKSTDLLQDIIKDLKNDIEVCGDIVDNVNFLKAIDDIKSEIKYINNSTIILQL